MIERLRILKSKKFSSATELQNALKNDHNLRREIEVLSARFLGRSVSGCGNCFFDPIWNLVDEDIPSFVKFSGQNYDKEFRLFFYSGAIF
jgi:hypothetical protein